MLALIQPSPFAACRGLHGLWGAVWVRVKKQQRGTGNVWRWWCLRLLPSPLCTDKDNTHRPGLSIYTSSESNHAQWQGVAACNVFRGSSQVKGLKHPARYYPEEY